MAEALVEVEGVTRRFGRLTAVKDMSFTVEKGTICGFIGPNGAGKTTTMRILATLDLPDEGDARIGGVSILDEPEQIRRRVGFMADKFEPYPNLDVMQFLNFFARAQGLTGKERRNTVEAVADFCGLTGFRNRPTTGLSKGMAQRLQLAKTILHRPDFLILDEPAAGLDPRARIEFRGLIRELAADGVAILISSHILAELSESCDSVLVIEHGKAIVQGSIGDVSKTVRDTHRIGMRVLGDLDPAERWLVLQPGVDELEILEGRLDFSFAGDDEATAALLKRAIEEGLQVVDFAAHRADLEDIFMHATRGRLQ